VHLAGPAGRLERSHLKVEHFIRSTTGSQFNFGEESRSQDEQGNLFGHREAAQQGPGSVDSHRQQGVRCDPVPARGKFRRRFGLLGGDYIP